MSNLEHFKAMLTGSGTKWKEQIHQVNKPIGIERAVIRITVQNTQLNPNNELGYQGYHSIWYFDDDGNMVGVGHWHG